MIGKQFDSLFPTNNCSTTVPNNQLLTKKGTEMKKLTAKPLSELLKEQYPGQKWLVNNIIPDSGLVLLSAAPASFKTWVALEISLCIADEKPLFSTFNTSKCGVLIADEESGSRMLQDRFIKLGAKSSIDEAGEYLEAEKPIYCLSRVGRRIDEDYIKELIAECVRHEIKLVIFDSLVRFHSARENDASEMAKTLNLFKVLNDNGIATLLLHHNRKGFGLAGEMVRGSSDILASCDIHMSITRKGRKITISQTKNRYMEELQPFTVELDRLEDHSEFKFLGYQNDKENQQDELKKLVIEKISNHPGINKSQLVSKISKKMDGVALNRISKIINELIEDEIVRTEQGVKNSLRLFITEQEE